jgi:hypothetical protein
MGKNSILEENLLEGIESNLNRINPVFLSLISSNKFRKSLIDIADKHSVELELPGQSNKSTVYKEYLGGLDEAHNYFKKNYSGLLTEDLIKYLSGKILNQYFSQYRDCAARANVMGLSYPNPLKIPEEILKFIHKNNSISNNIEKAFNAHFNLARIHPFNDGNGRLARFVQNSILVYSGIPPVNIFNFERRNYLDLICSAEKEYYSLEGKVGEEQKKFYSFLGEKLLQSIEDLDKVKVIGVHNRFNSPIKEPTQNEGETNQEYKIILEGIRDRGILRTITSSLRSETKRVNPEGSTFSEKKNRGKDYEITYQGRLESSVIETALGKLANKYNFRYEIKHN